MKSWLRRLVSSVSRKSEPAAETTWHAEDFEPAPEKLAPLDPWAAQLATPALREASAPASSCLIVPARPPSLEVPVPEEMTTSIAPARTGLAQDVTSWSECDIGFGDACPPPKISPPEMDAPTSNWFEPEVSPALAYGATICVRKRVNQDEKL